MFAVNKFVVNKKDPFDGDELGRKETCEMWTRFIENCSTPLVLAVDAEWGNGKTVFVEMWDTHLKNQGFKTVFFDAWKCDFYDEALPALIGEIQEQVEMGKGFEDKAKDLVKFLPSMATKVLISKIAGEAGKEILAELQKETWQHDKVKDYLNYREAVEEFKEELKKTTEEEKKPLVIFIDELDRCRPTFALEVLEKVKHIFDVKGIFFVIAINRMEFVKTIKSEYGDIDGNIYLQKFFDVTIKLKNDTERSTATLLKKAGMSDYELLSSILSTACSIFDVSLRTREQIIFLLSIALTDSSKHDPFLFRICCFFATLKLTKPELFNEIVDSLNGNSQKKFPNKKIKDLFTEITDEVLNQNFGERSRVHERYVFCGTVYYMVTNMGEPAERTELDESVDWKVIRYTAEEVIDHTQSRSIIKRSANKIDQIELPAQEKNKDRTI